MEVKNDLAAAPLHIEKQLVTRPGDSLFARYPDRFPDHLRKNARIRIRQVIEAPDVFLRNYKEVNWSTRMDIPEHYKKLISVEEFSGFFTSDNFTEEAILFHGLPETKGACSGSEPVVDHIPSNV